MERKLVVRYLGRVEYEDGLNLMQGLSQARDQGKIHDTLLLLEHPPVITRGRGAKPENILLSDDELAERGVQVYETDRGGDVTYHGPGQLVGYPIVDLKPDRRDVRRYVTDVEEGIIRTLAQYGIEAGLIPKWTGVWVGKEEDPDAAKIAALGVHIKRWVTTHGFALNVMPDLSHFGMIVPCGITERGVTSMSQRLGRLIDPDEVAPVVARELAGVFGWPLEEQEIDLETISVAVLRPGPEGPEVLVLQRTVEMGGFRQIVTGKIDPGETPKEAAQRELAEETGFSAEVEDLRYVHAFGFGDDWKIVREHAFAAFVEEGASVRLQPSEHVEAEWMPVARALEALPFAGLKRAVEKAVQLGRARDFR